MEFIEIEADVLHSDWDPDWIAANLDNLVSLGLLEGLPGYSWVRCDSAFGHITDADDSMPDADTIGRRTRTLLEIENESAWAEALSQHRRDLIETLHFELETRTEGPLHPDIEIDYGHPSEAAVDAAETRWKAWQDTIREHATSQVDNAIATCRANSDSF